MRKGHKYKCTKCGDIIQSQNRHDMVYCKCGECSVDGGSSYCKISYKTAPPVPYVDEVE